MVKETIKDKDQPIIPEKIRAVGDIVRPFTLIAAFIAGVFIAGFSLLLSGQPIIPALPDLIYVGVTLALLQGGSQAINMSYKEEVEIDKLNGKGLYRPIGDVLSPEEGTSIGFLLILFGITRAFTVDITFGLFSVLITFFGIFYTLPPFRIKRFFILNNLWQGFSRGFLPVVACFSIFGSPLNPIALGWGLVVFLWASGGQISKDFGDEFGDREYNIRTCPVVLGRKTSVFTIAFFMFSAFFLLMILWDQGILPIYFRYMGVLVLPSLLMLYDLYTTPKELDKLENNVSWVAFYLSLGLWFMLPLLLKLVM